ncbi:uncharacterized protein MICPUCDRAFT_52939 [Micromonas pusilla CCMP1545]|uniref:Predicted protein n=1 Tax=Micromonas pusilla (strain CCMP1545) TaxID=564608 RepID=C1N5I7_MICPC|nr:uncharacterized protein MICPUCDRAFT_52939 [Micromonas pusilla CCMP1545]EEH52506.1 predicted protein [Micromonas pusilla CCMP1545]|eukprot:XP_003063370.1 predicted protein [Micromonas pusilla CCMP1545]
MGLMSIVGKVVKFAEDHADYFHYAMIPAIIIVGMHTTPRPGLAALLTPV